MDDLKFNYCLYRIGEALKEMGRSKRYTGWRHLEKALYVTTGFLNSEVKFPSYEEMREIEKTLIEQLNKKKAD